MEWMQPHLVELDYRDVGSLANLPIKYITQLSLNSTGHLLCIMCCHRIWYVPYTHIWKQFKPTLDKLSLHLCTQNLFSHCSSSYQYYIRRRCGATVWFSFETPFSNVCILCVCWAWIHIEWSYIGAYVISEVRASCGKATPVLENDWWSPAHYLLHFYLFFTSLLGGWVLQ